MPDRDYAIRVDGLVKHFARGSPRQSLLRTLAAFLRGTPGVAGRYPVLQGVTFDVRKGETTGVIGNNGAGKSTLLRLVGGLLVADAGQVQVQGEATLLAGLGLGMVDELTVEQNIYLYSAIHGLVRERVAGLIEEILEWAELAGFRYERLRNLSTGMRSRLAFSVTRHFESDIFLLDEALTAGDRAFREKCEETFLESRRKARTMLIASHDFPFVERSCDRLLWLNKGQQMAFGDTGAVLSEYRAWREKRPEKIA